MPDRFRSILGIRFYVGDMEGLLELAGRGGLIAVPSAPVLADLPRVPAHREALESSDFAITDSGFMVMLWGLFKRERLPRISGLKFLRGMVRRPEFRAPGAVFWVMPSADDAAANIRWLQRQGISVEPSHRYLAPIYPSGPLSDDALLAAIESARPKFVVLCLGGGVQERLGYFLRSRLSYRPAILCTGAAIAFLSGRQVNIPPWADHLVIGWLLRLIKEPARFIPRYWKSLRLVRLLWKFGERSVDSGRSAAIVAGVGDPGHRSEAPPR